MHIVIASMLNIEQQKHHFASVSKESKLKCLGLPLHFEDKFSFYFLTNLPARTLC